MNGGAGVVIVGGGVMGCATAFELAKRGSRVLVLERSVPGAEASSAAAGMLGAQVEASQPGPFAELCIASRNRFANFAEELRERSGIDVEYRRCGIAALATNGEQLREMRAHASWQRAVGMRAEDLGPEGARACEPASAPAVVGGVHYPDDARVDPPKLLRALRISAERAGAEFRSGALVRGISHEGSGPRVVELEAGQRIEADHLVLAAGSWTAMLGNAPLPSQAIRPARGQIVELVASMPPLRGVISGKRAYLCPRDDGRVLVGSTLEFVGFERGVTASAVRELLDAAIELVPSLGKADLGRCWSSFRPHTGDELPFIGSSGIERVWLASGHFRNGILLSVITAEILGALIEGREPPLDPRPFESSAGSRRSVSKSES